MSYSKKLLGLVAATVAMMTASQMPVLSEESQYLLSSAIAQEENTEARKAEAESLLDQGIVLLNSSQFQEAIRVCEQALIIFRDLGELENEGVILNILGSAYESLGQYSQSIDSYEQALAIFRGIDSHIRVAGVLNSLSYAYENTEQYAQAISIHKEVLNLARQANNRIGEMSTLMRLGYAHYELNQNQEAIDSYEQALAIARELNNRSEGEILNGLGLAHEALGQSSQAIRFYEQAIDHAQLTANPSGLGRALGNLGNIHLALGNYHQAIRLFDQRLTSAQNFNDPSGVITALRSLGNAYSDLGQYSKAIEFYQQSLHIARMTGDRRAEGLTLGGLSVAYGRTRQHQQSINLLLQSLSILEPSDFREISALLNNLGIFYYYSNQYQQAIDVYQRALEIDSDYIGKGVTIRNLGDTYRGLGQYAKAFEFYNQALSMAHETGNLQQMADIFKAQGIAHIDLGQFSQAETVLQQSIETYEELRANLSDSQLISLADAQRDAYLYLELSLVSQGKIAEALVTSERGRARAFVLQIASRFSALEEHTATLANSFSVAPKFEEIQQIAKDTDATLVTYSLLADAALYIWVVQPSGEIAFRSVEFESSGGEGLAFNPISAIDGPVYRSAPDDSELGQLVADSRATILVESTNTRPEQLRELHTLLINPITDLLPTDPEAKVVFVPQGNLFLVPFAALQDADGTYLIEKHTILTAPSIQVYGLANEAASTTAGANGGSPFSTNNALIVGNPTMPTVWSPTASGDFAETQLTDLPGAKAEAEAIGGFLNITPLVGSQATEARVKQLLPSARLIHLATHGLLDYGDPRAYGTLDFPGAIALAPSDREDGLLTSAEILEMDLQAELAVLSACDTGRGRITGDGVVGLSRSLITAGVPSVVVSLWAVPDAPTAELMTEFYRQLNQGQDKAQALRQAMLTTLEQHPNPRNWAAFTLIGAAE